MKPVRLALLVGAALSLSGFASGRDVFSAKQADRLAAEVVQHTPEYLHWAKGTRFSWVLLDTPDRDFVDVAEKVRTLLRKRYTVYTSESEVPESLIQHDTNEGLGPRYIHGFRFSWRITTLSGAEIEVEYSDYEAPLAASSQTVRYRWTGSRWRFVRSGPLAVS